MTEIQVRWLPSVLGGPEPAASFPPHTGTNGARGKRIRITDRSNTRMNGTKTTIPNRSFAPSFWGTLFVAPLLPGVAYLFGVGLPPVEFLLLAAAIFVGVLLSGYEGRVPFTEVRLAPVDIVVFWSILNLGGLAGWLVAAAAVLSRFSAYRQRRSDWLRFSLSALAPAIAAGAVYALAFSYFTAVGMTISPASRLVSSEVIFAAAVMLAVHQAVWSAVTWLISIKNAETVGKTSSRLACHLPGQFFAAVSALSIFAALEYFGDAFGLVVVPLVVLGNLAYHVHVKRLEQKTRELVEASRLHLATVEALATAIDARDQVGIGHVRRTQIYAVGVGTALGLSDEHLDALRAGALLHDIGKLAVPEHILNKPGRLTSAELEKTKIHADVGASILEKVGFPYPVVPTVRHHHEFWDGSGYPDGLKGDDIPVTARILSVADAYDALRGTRPFRSPVNREDACNFLRSRAGTQFDPHVVNTFLRGLKQLEAEIEIHGFGYESEVKNAEKSAGRASYVEQIKRANQEVFSLYEMARDFGSSLNLEDTLGLLTRKVREFVPYDTCLVYLLDGDGEHATAAHVEGRNSAALLGKRIAVGEGASGFVLKKRKPVENVDPSLDFAFSHAEICGQYVGMASVPLMAEERLVGAISVFTDKLAVYEEEHLRLLETISRIAGDAISKSQKHAETEVHAQTDPLTGLPNARGLQMQFEKEIGRARRAGASLQVLMLDLDGFKAVNDNLGHKAGDTVLKEVGRIIKDELRDYDFLARYGGDEFVALIPGTDSADVIELCSRIETAVGAFSLTADGVSASVGVSVGSAGYPAQGESFEDLLIAADKAMYRTKAFHKQRLEKLGVPVLPDSLVEIEQALDSYTAEASGTVISEPPANAGGELVVELDESHIVVVNTVN